MSTNTKAKSNCWTCKDRKIGCDRSLPHCNNCTKANRLCKGYGLKLSWPDKVDGRRKQKRYDAAPEASATCYVSKNGKFTFLNSTFRDLEGSRIALKDLVGPAPRSLGLGLVGEGDGALLTYYDTILSRMITTIDDNTNGFRHELIPIALSSSEASSQGLLEATLALSSFHLGKQEEALMHKVKAINSLSKSFNGQNASRIAQFSACMMLCVYSVFDASDTTWNVHLQGAKTLSQSFSPQERNMPGLAFLDSWLEYHDTFAAYSHRCQSPGPRVEDILLPESSPTNQKIIGLLGCSTELIRLISCINQLRTLMPLPRLSPLRSTVADLAHAIHERLLHIKQEVFIQAEDNAEMDICHSRITLTAELYRLATLLYLHQTLSPSYSLPIAQIENDSYITAALAVLDQMEICSSPWPLFIIANAVSDDADRIKIMGFVVHGARSRQIGNYGIIANLIEAVWKQRDLTADGKEERRVDWRDVVGGEGGMPSFI